MSKKFRRFFDLAKVAPLDDGSGAVRVTGILSTEDEDEDGEFISAGAMRDAIPDYMKFGAVREMHDDIAAGVMLHVSVGEDDRTYCEADLVDEGTIKKLLHDPPVLKGWSVGGKKLKRDPNNKKRITKIRLTEASLVDRPNNHECLAELAKFAGGDPDDGADGELEDDMSLGEENLEKIAAREDTTPKEGEDKYGDVAFADPKNKKYPINTKAHAKNALSRWGDPANRAKYSAEDQKTIGARIRAAAKKFGIEVSDDDAAAKKSSPGGAIEGGDPMFETLRKMFTGEEVWDASRAIDALNTVISLLSKEMAETGEDPGQVEGLTKAMEGLKAFIVSEIQENSVLKASHAEDLHKAGAKFAAATKEKLAEAHDHIKKCSDALGKCSDHMTKASAAMEGSGYQGDDQAQKASSTDDLHKASSEKITALETQNEELKKSSGTLTAELEELRKSSSALKEEFETLKKASDEAATLLQDLLTKRKGAVRVVPKEGDTGINKPETEDLTKRAPANQDEATTQARTLLSRAMRGEAN